MGSNFIHTALKFVPRLRVINLDKLTYAGNSYNLFGIDRRRYHFVKGDICNTALLRRLMKKADFVVNFAAETHVDRSIHGEADQFVKTNIVGVHSLLEALRLSPRVERMVQISTDEVWGDLPLGSRKKFTEKSPFAPSSPYAASKAAGDLLVRAYVHTYGAPVIVTHSVNNFGPRQYPEKLIPFFTLRALQGLPLPLYGDGKNVRDWIYVDDHTNAILTILARGISGSVYGISSAEEHSNRDIAERILRAVPESGSHLVYVTDRPGHDRRYAIDAGRLRMLGWKPEYSFVPALAHTIMWYQKNPQWITHTLSRTSKLNAHIV